MQAINPQHHLGEATLLSYAAGALPVALGIVAATHLGMCAACRRQLRVAECIGGGLIAMRHDTPPSEGARAAMLARLGEPVRGGPEAAEPPSTMVDPDALPVPLQPYFGPSFAQLRWHWMAPGMRGILAAVGEGLLLMLSIAPGKGLPMHGHRGSELTCVLQGAYDDEFGHFTAGDLADLGSDDRHRPVMAAGMPCICVGGLEGGLRYDNWFARAAQPLFGL